MHNIKHITNIQRFELLEERLGIAILNVGASLQKIYSDDLHFTINIAGEIVALSGGELEHDVNIKIIASDADGNGLGGTEAYFSKDRFFGIDTFVEKFNVPTTDVVTIKIFPVKGY